MSAWGNSDNHNQKPKSPYEREVREVLQLTVSTGNTAGNTIITVAYNDGGQNNVANIGVAAGQYTYFWPNGTSQPGGLAGNGVPGMFASNNTVAAVSGNTITLTNALFNNITAGQIFEVDRAIVYQVGEALATYNQDTVLITASRSANANSTIAPIGNLNAGWVHVQKKTNNDGTVRLLKETLVCLANATATNGSSANTSFGNIATGL